MKPDKGNGIVILNKTDYINKMHNIIDDTSKFKIINEDWFRVVLRHEDRINRFLAKLHKENNIDKALYEHLRVTGSQPGVLYGLPKVHKSQTPLRPILSAIGTAGYSISKYLVPFLSPITINDFTIKDSFSFAKDIVNFQNCNDYVMTSFDIKSLFTNIPLDETIKIACNLLYDNDQFVTPPMSKIDFKKLLEMATKEILFIFNDKLYSQIDGVAMGNPLGPTLANIFLCYYEQIWLQNCPHNCKPIMYKRYIDDTFILFQNSDQAKLFLDYLNSQHPNITFTSEIEKD